MALRKFKMICAVDENMGIAKDNKMPWNLPNELAYFLHQIRFRNDERKRNAAIMGSNTWFDNPAGKDHHQMCYILVSRTLSEPPPGADHLCRSVTDAVKLVSSSPLADTIENVWIIGGSEIYTEALGLPQCHRIYLTRVYATFDCNVFFPEFDTKKYRLVSDPAISEEVQEEKGIKYKFEIYERLQE